jgi:hypothetical protein
LLVGNIELLGNLWDGIAADGRADGTVHDLHDTGEKD